MKKIITCLLLCSISSLFSQKITFNIENDTIGSTFSIRKVTNEVVRNVTLKELNFDLDGISLDEGYYILKKEEDKAVLYIKPEHELTISFDAEDFHNSIEFTGKGALINKFLAEKNAIRLSDNGTEKKYYDRDFYEGNESNYLKKIDGYYKGLYGTLFSGNLDKDFVEEEMKNLQYGYSLDLLKYEDAKAYYQFNDSIYPSKAFLEPLTNIHFDTEYLFEKYESYAQLSVLKWRKDLENAADLKMMRDILSSIRTQPLKQSVLESLFELMSADTPQRTRDYFSLIKSNSATLELTAKAKTIYDQVRLVEAEKNLSKFDFLTSNEEEVKLAEYKGNYILMNIWASWCEGCVQDFETIEQLKKEYHDYNIVFINISVDKKEDFSKWLSIIEKNSNKGAHLFFDGSKGKFVKTYNISSMPTCVLLSDKGKVITDKLKLSSKKTRRLLDKIFTK
ncbi:TlpA disulfide reductase family protein [uncultured Tenacibaculum sp.]|uniref:TlpA family protein disulfide reductase n=1 Tax=uncultured Tenacibaculum sp. TaxID=174713 RepID=UPI00261C6F3A|nr:TlpA disulfide reductase family protein [uncultured Tenacibaculum sp.]